MALSRLGVIGTEKCIAELACLFQLDPVKSFTVYMSVKVCLEVFMSFLIGFS